MSAIINSIIARQAGQASHHSETRQGITAGHRQDEPGLRGHSVGDTFPYGVTGYGSKWAVTKHGAPLLIHAPGDGIYRALYGDCKHAHLAAETLKLRDETGAPLQRIAEPTDWATYATKY